MVRKFFPLDKNYLLEAAQLRSKDRLLAEMIDLARSRYQQIHNPLGLNDSFSEMIAGYIPTDARPLSEFYENLAGVYRFKFGETQLGFLWDGRDHTDKYEEDWVATFNQWIEKLCERPQFIQAVLDLTVFLPSAGQSSQMHLAENRMNAVMLGLFELKIDKRKGIVQMKVA
ncbi:MAG TPA: hypothetical protein VG737_09480 [Cyclobacteriaceae bacterium]|nr:hypothetical protein [Cyclobacteriaceae bacterium]